MIYADSSFLVSLYLPDRNSVVANAEMQAIAKPVALSRVAELEVRNAFRLAVFRKWISAEQARGMQGFFDLDSKGGFLQPIPFNSEEVFAEAERLSDAYSALRGNRSLDILHVACACLAGVEVFASFDERQRVLASEVGLRLIPSADRIQC